MRIEVLFDKEAKNKTFRTGWGVSFLIDEKVLFDTGENGKWLVSNIEKQKIDIDRIEAVVISHDHWDHTGGLWELLRKRKGLAVYACPGFGEEFKEKVKSFKGKLIETQKAAEISENIFVTGEIAGEYDNRYMPEQALVVRMKKGLIIITGCAHPGIIKIVEKVKIDFPKEQIYLALGGFHLMNLDRRAIEVIVDKFKELAILKAAPTHCSGKAAENIFKKKYGKNFISVQVGQVLDI